MSRPFFLFPLLLVPTVACPAEVYRCLASDGSISFQQTACQEAGERIQTGEAQAVWVSLREEERKLYESYRRRDRKRIEAQRKAERKQVARRKEKGATTCYNKQHSLDEVQAKLRTGYKPAEGDRLRRRRDYLEGYIRRFCR